MKTPRHIAPITTTLLMSLLFVGCLHDKLDEVSSKQDAIAFGQAQIAAMNQQSKEQLRQLELNFRAFSSALAENNQSGIDSAFIPLITTFLAVRNDPAVSGQAMLAQLAPALMTMRQLPSPVLQGMEANYTSLMNRNPQAQQLTTTVSGMGL